MEFTINLQEHQMKIVDRTCQVFGFKPEEVVAGSLGDGIEMLTDVLLKHGHLKSE